MQVNYLLMYKYLSGDFNVLTNKLFDISKS